jgi:hypothetical protein
MSRELRDAFENASRFMLGHKKLEPQIHFEARVHS